MKAFAFISPIACATSKVSVNCSKATTFPPSSVPAYLRTLEMLKEYGWSASRCPELPGIGFEGKADLHAEMKALAS